MGFEAIFTLCVIGAMFIALVFEVLEADIVFFSALAILYISGTLNFQEAFIGFSNKGMLTIGLLYIVAFSARSSGFLEYLSTNLLGGGKGYRRFMLKMMLPVSTLSAFLNNTPIVAMFTPAIREWALRNDKPPSKFLIPLSYASIFGGICTLIGTSTNLVVNGLLQQELNRSLTMFELAYVGVPAALAGMLYLTFVGYRLLPARRDLSEGLMESGREYLVEMEIQRGSPLVGKSVEEGHLRNLTGLFLAKILRENETLGPVKPTDILLAGDRLVFTGLVNSIVQLQKIPGLIPVQDSKLYGKLMDSSSSRIIEAVVSRSHPLLGQTIREGNFRSRYDSAILAVHRNGERIRSKIGDIVLRPGDTLLLLAGDDFLKIWNRSRDFFMVSKVTDAPAVDRKKAAITIGTILVMVLLAALGILEIFKAAILAGIVLIITRCISPHEARKSIEWNVLILIACAFGISKALDKTGAASYLAGMIIDTVKVFGPVGVLAAIYLATSLLTEVITNNAAAALAFPIAISASSQIGASPMPFVIAVAIAASASFATPIGYQTNLIVYGPGSYKFRDFLKVGGPLNLLFMVVAIVIIPLVWKF